MPTRGPGDRPITTSPEHRAQHVVSGVHAVAAIAQLDLDEARIELSCIGPPKPAGAGANLAAG